MPDDRRRVLGDGSTLSAAPVTPPTPFDEPVAGVPEQPGRYRAMGAIGRGGMGEVSVVYDHVLAREVARKAARSDRPGARLRPLLVREARAMACLDHPNIPPVYELGVGADGVPYYTMRLVDGRRLGDCLTLAGGLEGRLRLLGALVAAGQAVAYAHRRRVLHRDLSPGNILVGDLGETFVIDWGLATTDVGEGVASPPPDAPTFATPRELGGGPAGTPGYVAPELLAGGEATPASDQWAFGALLHLLLTGRAPRVEGAADGRRVPVAAWEIAPRGVPAPLVSIARRALADDPAERYPSVEALIADVQAWLEGRPVGAHRYGRRERIERVVRAHPRVFLASVAAVVLTILATAGVVGLVRADAAERAQLAHDKRVEGAGREGVAAVVALQAGRYAEAARLALESLAVVEDPEVRGVLVAAGRAWAPRVGGEAAIRRCTLGRLSPSGSALLCLTADGVTLVDLPSGAPVASVALEPVTIPESIAWSEDGRRVAVSAAGEDIFVLDGATLAVLDRWQEPARSSSAAIAFLPGGYDLGIADYTRSWIRRQDGAETDVGVRGSWIVTGRGPDGEPLGITGNSDVVRIFSGADPAGFRDVREVYGGEAVFVPERGEVVTTTSFAGGGSRLFAIDVRTGAVRVGPSLPVGGVLELSAESADALWLESVSGRVALVNLATLAVTGEVALAAQLGGTVSGPAGRKGVLVRTEDPALMRLVRLAPPEESPPRVVELGQQGPLGLALTPDGRRLVVPAHEGAAFLVDWASGRVVRRWRAPTGLAGSAIFRGDEVLLSSGGGRWVGCRPDADACELRGVLPDDPFDQFLATPDGGFVAWGGPGGALAVAAGGEVRWARPGDGSVLRVLPRPAGRGVLTVAMSGAWEIQDPLGDGTPLVRGEVGRTLWTFPAVSPQGDRVYSGTGGTRDVELVSFPLDDPAVGIDRRAPLPTRVTYTEVSPSGRTVAAALLDGTIRLFDADTLHERAVLRGHEGQSWGMVFIREDLLATVGSEGALRLWSLADLYTEP